VESARGDLRAAGPRPSPRAAPCARAIPTDSAPDNARPGLQPLLEVPSRQRVGLGALEFSAISHMVWGSDGREILTLEETATMAELVGLAGEIMPRAHPKIPVLPGTGNAPYAVVHALRAKLRRVGSSGVIATQFGSGYRLALARRWRLGVLAAGPRRESIELAGSFLPIDPLQGAILPVLVAYTNLPIPEARLRFHRRGRPAGAGELRFAIHRLGGILREGSAGEFDIRAEPGAYRLVQSPPRAPKVAR